MADLRIADLDVENVENLKGKVTQRVRGVRIKSDGFNYLPNRDEINMFVARQMLAGLAAVEKKHNPKLTEEEALANARKGSPDLFRQEMGFPGDAA